LGRQDTLSQGITGKNPIKLTDFPFANEARQRITNNQVTACGSVRILKGVEKFGERYFSSG
jgi:hypothetical protein